VKTKISLRTFVRAANPLEIKDIKDGSGVWGLGKYSGLTTRISFAVSWGDHECDLPSPSGLIVLNCEPSEVIPTEESHFRRFRYLYEIARLPEPLERPPKAVLTNWEEGHKVIRNESLRYLPPSRILAIIPINRALVNYINMLRSTPMNKVEIHSNLLTFLLSQNVFFPRQKDYEFLTTQLVNMMFDTPQSKPWEKG